MNVKSGKVLTGFLITIYLAFFSAVLICSLLEMSNLVKMFKPADNSAVFTEVEEVVEPVNEALEYEVVDDNNDDVLKGVENASQMQVEEVEVFGTEDVIVETPETLTEEEGYDYSTEGTESFNDSFVLHEEDPFAPVTEVYENVLPVTFNSLDSVDTVNAIWDKAQKDETFDDAVNERATQSIKELLIEAKEKMVTVEGKTTSISFEYYADSYGELFLKLNVMDENSKVCFSGEKALGALVGVQ